MPKNKERTWIELLKACMDYKSNGFNEVLWAYVTALRGPDIIIAFAETDRHLKAVFTCPLRGTYVNMDVRDYLKLLPIHIENAFKKLNDEKKIYTYTHYLDHIKMVWQYFNPKVKKILDKLTYWAGDLSEEEIKDLAYKYKQYVDEWLESKEIFLKE